MATLLHMLQALWEYVNNAFWNIAMSRNGDDRAFVEEEDCDWP